MRHREDQREDGCAKRGWMRQRERERFTCVCARVCARVCVCTCVCARVQRLPGIEPGVAIRPGESRADARRNGDGGADKRTHERPMRRWTKHGGADKRTNALKHGSSPSASMSSTKNPAWFIRDTNSLVREIALWYIYVNTHLRMSVRTTHVVSSGPHGSTHSRGSCERTCTKDN